MSGQRRRDAHNRDAHQCCIVINRACLHNHPPVGARQLGKSRHFHSSTPAYALPYSQQFPALKGRVHRQTRLTSDPSISVFTHRKKHAAHLPGYPRSGHAYGQVHRRKRTRFPWSNYSSSLDRLHYFTHDINKFPRLHAKSLWTSITLNHETLPALSYMLVLGARHRRHCVALTKLGDIA